MIIVFVVIILFLGYILGKEYVELEWLIDIVIVVVWVVYVVVFFGILVKCKIFYIYVVNWFFGVFIIIVVVLYIVNSMVFFVLMGKFYFIYVGVVDVMV